MGWLNKDHRTLPPASLAGDQPKLPWLGVGFSYPHLSAPQAGVFPCWPGLHRVLVAEFMGLVILHVACCHSEPCGPASL